jgi:TolB protein
MAIGPCFRAAVLTVSAACGLGSPAMLGAPQTQGWFEGHGDVGSPAIAGSTTYDPANQSYTLVGAGTNMWAARDEFQFAWRRLRGDFILRANAAFLGKGTEAHRKLGWIVRSSLDPASPYVDAAVHGDGLTSLQFRRTAGADTEETRSTIAGPDIVQLERTGGAFTMSVAKSGGMFARTALTNVDLGDEVYVGLFVCSHNATVSESAVFHNVRIVVPPKTGWVPYRDYIGSNVELMTIDDGHRTVVHTSPVSIQAPNWTKDGRSLIYNSAGRLYRFDLASRRESPIDTGSATANNNDHVLSFDGTMLGISNQSAADRNESAVWIVPVTGGTPTRVTRNTPSYMHGWSPDGTRIVYTGQRNGEFDIYRIAVSGGAAAQEERLTTAAGLDDGPEFSPDGKWIYFNSARTGRMQIWRMRPDGSGQEQITHDELNDWFPHLSPDGRWMVVISFPSDVRPDDHPFYRQVYVRLMRPDGSDARVAAYVFGGQGTINVPSWSPDSARLAFVSNSALTAPH